MSTETNRSHAVGYNLLFILFFNAFFWVLVVIVSTIQLHGQECFSRVFPVVVGGTCVAFVAVISAWRLRQHTVAEGTADKAERNRRNLLTRRP